MKYGKWLAGGLGWAFGGPIGGILGFVLGSVYDNAEEVTVQQGRRVGTSRSGDFAASLLVLTAAVMKADDRILKAELDFVKAFFLRQFGAHYAREQMLVLREILKQDIPLRDVCLQIKQHIDHPSRLQLLHYLFGISMADGEVHPSEVKVIEQIAAYLGISDADFGSIKAMFVKDRKAAYHILEIEPEATDEEVKKAYRRMAVKYHPDKVSHLGEEFQKAANEKFQKVNDAFQQIKKERGFA
ncbi:MAG: DnaJ-like protein DjlA [Bacteroidia bacterium]|nr:DnaJ-like protein DjlA [Bacteroidia bacterium]